MQSADTPRGIIRSSLYEMADPGYAAFMASLLPTVSPARIIGVRIPAIRAYATRLSESEQAVLFLSSLPHTYYEEDLLHAFLIMNMKDLTRQKECADTFLPYIDNWGVCDSFAPRCYSSPAALPYLYAFLSEDGAPYRTRFGLVRLLRLPPAYGFSKESLTNVRALSVSPRAEHHDVRGAIAWYLSAGMVYVFDDICRRLCDGEFPAVIRKLTIRKGIESYRLTGEQKEQLRQLRTLH